MNAHVHPTLAGILNSMSSDLAADNAAAAKVQAERDWAVLEKLLKQHGVANVIGVVTDWCADQSDELDPLMGDEEQAERGSDYRLAAAVLEAAARGCDLTYGNRTAREWRRARYEAVTEMKAQIGKVRA
jgi:hypothetical protein